MSACDHDYRLLSCIGDGEGTATIRVRCAKCERVLEMRGCYPTGVSYGPPTEDLKLEEVDPAVQSKSDAAFFDWTAKIRKQLSRKTDR